MGISKQSYSEPKGSCCAFCLLEIYHFYLLPGVWNKENKEEAELQDFTYFEYTIIREKGFIGIFINM